MAIVFNSDQYAKVIGTPSKLVKPNEFGGRLRVFFASCTLGATVAIGDTIQLGVLPIGARLIEGNFCWSATQGASATTAIGTIVGATTTAAAYFAAAATASAAKFAFLATQALGYGTVLTAATLVLVTNATAAWTAASVFNLELKYIVD